MAHILKNVRLSLHHVGAACLVALIFFPFSALAETITFGTSDNAAFGFGRNDGGTTMHAQSFIPASDADSASVTLHQAREGSSLSGTVSVSIESDSSGVPSGSVLGSASLPASTLNGDGGAYTCASHTTMAYPSISGLSLVGGTKYWVVTSWSTTGAPDNIPADCVQNTSPRLYYFESGPWTQYPSDYELVGNILLAVSGGGGTTTATSTSPMGYNDTLFIACIFLFFVSMQTWSRIVPSVKKLYDNSH